jgi:chemotaxis protein MotB
MRRVEQSIIAGGLILASGMACAGVTSEQIYYLAEDGLHALVYKTSRSDYERYTMWFRQGSVTAPEKHLDDFLYLFPQKHQWQSDAKPGYDLLQFPGGNFASMERVSLGLAVTHNASSDGHYTFSNWDRRSKTPDGHYGVWNAPDPFEQIAYSWVFPDNLEPVSYDANRKGEWIARNNTITYYGSDVNDLTFTIRYRPRSNDTYQALKSGLQGETQVQVEQQSDGVKLTLEETLLFPSGVAELSGPGKSVLAKVADTLKERDDIALVAAGHTDDVPIGSDLAPRYATNWELSAARAMAVIHFLGTRGIAGTQMEARAYGPDRPRASNATAEGRSKNRRTELLIYSSNES